MDAHDEERPQPKHDRREELTLAAFHVIARKGFEGLRVREVAAQVGINGATLHHYFPTKEDLIRSVVAHAISRLRTVMAGRLPDAAPPEQLRDHLSRLFQLMQEEPDLFVVLTEVNLRARRTPVLAYLTEQNSVWHGMLVSILERGISEKFWPSDLDPGATAAAIITLLEGMTFWAATAPDWGAKALSRLERWLGIA